MALRSAQFWGAVVAVSAALAVVAGYLAGGPRAVWIVAAVETVLVMAHVGRKFRAKAHPGPVGEGPGAAHCERCRRAQERLELRASSAGRAVRDQ
ncbi:hypothetical protein [Streptomyces sp. NRRL B-24484]|uniref:hypothetical protein n=1 Tax=Streptomyces sp. NRRL B-24484 TaxID=1463833 RepID=UPI0004BF3ECD|nr:hypothetical protein [Streptomyces sp. NRRL B-24484]